MAPSGKLKIRFLSDLHNEFRSTPIENVEAIGEDFVVLAGDIDVGMDGIRWAQKVFADRQVLYVLGNHEFYGHDWDNLLLEARAATAGSNVHLLERDSITLRGVRFLGCSLWTDFQLWGPAREMQAMGIAGNRLSDYRQIRRTGRPLRPFESLERHRESVAWLRGELSNDVPTVVVTHHAPTEVTSDPRFRSSISNAAYHSRLDELIRSPVLAWIHGHTHHSIREHVNGVPVCVNTFGYPGHAEDGGFSWNACIDLELP
jgi:Icc-related predicted phosphoesterase